MFQMLTGIFLLGLLVFPVLTLIIAFYQNLVDGQRINTKTASIIETQYGKEELRPVRLRAVK